MLRRAARVLRRGLFAMGLVFAVWYPTSLLSSVYIGRGPRFVSVFAGGVFCFYATLPPSDSFSTHYTDGLHAAFAVHPLEEIKNCSWPRFAVQEWAGVPGYKHYLLIVPLWLLAFLCLAWPVTSLVLARRRHKRGFPLEPKGGGETVSTRYPPVKLL